MEFEIEVRESIENVECNELMCYESAIYAFTITPHNNFIWLCEKHGWRLAEVFKYESKAKVFNSGCGRG